MRWCLRRKKELETYDQLVLLSVVLSVALTLVAFVILWPSIRKSKKDHLDNDLEPYLGANPLNPGEAKNGEPSGIARTTDNDVLQDDALAYLFLSLEGGPVARFKRDRVAERMTRQQINQAKDLVRIWEPVRNAAARGDPEAQQRLEELRQSALP